MALKKDKKKTGVTQLIFECPHCRKHIQATVYGVKLGKKEIL